MAEAQVTYHELVQDSDGPARIFGEAVRTGAWVDTISPNAMPGWLYDRIPYPARSFLVLRGKYFAYDTYTIYQPDPPRKDAKTVQAGGMSWTFSEVARPWEEWHKDDCPLHKRNGTKVYKDDMTCSVETSSA